MCVKRRFDEIERKTNEVFELNDLDVGSLFLSHFQAIGQFDDVLDYSFSNEKEIVSGKKFNQSQGRTMNVDGVVGKCLELDEDVAFEIFALGVEVAKADRKLRGVAMTLIVGSDGDVFDVGIEELVLFDCVLDFIENTVEMLLVVDFGDLVFTETPRFVDFRHEVFFVDVVTAVIAVFFSILLGDFRQVGEVGIEGNAVSAGAVLVPDAILNLDDDRFFGVVVAFDRFS